MLVALSDVKTNLTCQLRVVMRYYFLALLVELVLKLDVSSEANLKQGPW